MVGLPETTKKKIKMYTRNYSTLYNLFGKHLFCFNLMVSPPTTQNKIQSKHRKTIKKP